MSTKERFLIVSRERERERERESVCVCVREKKPTGRDTDGHTYIHTYT